MSGFPITYAEALDEVNHGFYVSLVLAFKPIWPPPPPPLALLIAAALLSAAINPAGSVCSSRTSYVIVHNALAPKELLKKREQPRAGAPPHCDWVAYYLPLKGAHLESFAQCPLPSRFRIANILEKSIRDSESQILFSKWHFFSPDDHFFSKWLLFSPNWPLFLHSNWNIPVVSFAPSVSVPSDSVQYGTYDPTKFYNQRSTELEVGRSGL